MRNGCEQQVNFSCDEKRTEKKLHFSVLCIRAHHLVLCVCVDVGNTFPFQGPTTPFAPSSCSPISDLMKVNEAAVNVNQKYFIHQAQSTSHLSMKLPLLLHSAKQKKKKKLLKNTQTDLSR